MTKIITRYFETPTKAEDVRQALLAQKLPKKAIHILSDASALDEQLARRNVADATIGEYKSLVAKGGAVVLVEAGYQPLGVAKITRETMATMGAASLPDLTEEAFVKDPPQKMRSVLDDHPLMLTRERDPDSTDYRMADWPIPLISRRKPTDAFAFPRHARMANWPFPLLSTLKPADKFAFPRHARMANFPLPLTFRREPADRYVFPRHAHMANWPIPLISKRKPYDHSAIPRHGRMATWPFPLLINGKTGTNALVPGAPRMANWPIPLLSDRKPFDKFAFPRHARMAKRFLPLLSKRKPFTGSIFSRHARMANFPIPLVIKSSDKPNSAKSGFLLSQLFGVPTLSGR